MGKLYCPYCDRKYTIEKKDRSDNLYCRVCGEYLIKKNLITIKTIVSLISIFSIILPFALLLFLSIKDYKNNNSKHHTVRLINFQDSIVNRF